MMLESNESLCDQCAQIIEPTWPESPAWRSLRTETGTNPSLPIGVEETPDEVDPVTIKGDEPTYIPILIQT